MDVGRVRFRVIFGVVIGYILLLLAVHLCIAVVQEEIGKIILLDQLDDPLLLWLCERIEVHKGQLCSLDYQQVWQVVAHSCLASHLHPHGEAIIVGGINHLIILANCKIDSCLSIRTAVLLVV